MPQRGTLQAERTSNESLDNQQGTCESFKKFRMQLTLLVGSKLGSPVVGCGDDTKITEARMCKANKILSPVFSSIFISGSSISPGQMAISTCLYLARMMGKSPAKFMSKNAILR